MSPHEVLRHLQRIQMSPMAGRQVTVSWIARQAGFHPRSVLNAARRGYITPAMARRLAPVIARLCIDNRGYNALSMGPETPLGRWGGGSAGMGRPGPRK